MSEVAPRKVRGAIVSAYQFCITIGLMLASVVTYATQNWATAASYRLPIGIQFAWASILGIGLLFLPETPRYFVRHGQNERAARSLARLRGQPVDSEFIEAELAEIVSNHDYEMQLVPKTGYFASWANCFQGSIWKPQSNLRRTILGTSLQMMQQWTGVNFIFYYSTEFFRNAHIGGDPFLISLIATMINVCATPISFWAIERFGRRPLLILGAFNMTMCQLIIAVAGILRGPDDKAVIKAEIAFVMIFIALFASTWGPGAWVVVGEVFNLPIRSRGVALSTASNWLWNFIISFITPYMIGEDRANMREKVFFVWGTLCFVACIYAYFLVPETKGLTLEQVDLMLEESIPRTSSKWRPRPDNLFTVRGQSMSNGNEDLEMNLMKGDRVGKKDNTG